jgi:hypothetical protein
MSEMQFKSQDEAIQYLHDLCLRGEVKENCQYSIIKMPDACFIEKTLIDNKEELIAFNFRCTNDGNTLLFLEKIENGFSFDFLCSKLRFKYNLYDNSVIEYTEFDDYECKHAFPVDHKALSEGIMELKNYFLKKLQSS